MSAILEFLVDRLLIATAFLAFGATFVQIAIWLTKPSSPRVQRFAWGCVLVQGLLLVRVPIAVPWLAAPEESRIERREEIVAPVVESAAQPSADVFDPPAPSVTATARPVTTSAQIARERPAVAVARPSGTQQGWNWRLIAAAIWSVGFCSLAVFAVREYVRFLGGLAGNVAASDLPLWQAEWETVCAAGRLRGEIRLRVTRQFGPALCWRPFRYEVLIPASVWQTLTPAQRCAILKHEMAHYERGDLWFSLGARLLAAVHWFNPLGWWAVSRFETCGEWVCDDRASEGLGRADFAQTLMQLAGARKTSAPLVDCALSGPLFGRIRRLLVAQELRDSFASRLFVFGVALATLVAGGIRFDGVSASAAAPTPLSTDAKGAKSTAPVGKTSSAASESAGPTGKDSFGDPLPEGAILRLGTGRFHPRDGVWRIAFAPDGKTLATTAVNASTISVISRDTGKIVREITPVKPVRWRHEAIAFIDNGAQLISIGRSGDGATNREEQATLRAWSVARGEETWSVPLGGYSGRSLAVSSDGKLIASGDDSGSAIVWDATSHRRLHAFQVNDDKRPRFPPKRFERRMAFTGAAPASEALSHIVALAFTPDSESLVAAEDGDTTIHVWDLKSGKERTRIPHAHGDQILSLAVTPDGRQIVSGGNRNVPGKDLGKPNVMKIPVPEIRFWNLANGVRMRELAFAEPTTGLGNSVLSPDGRTLLSAVDRKVVVWDVPNGLVRYEIDTPTWSETLALSADGSTLAAPVGSGRALNMWDIASGKSLLPNEVTQQSMPGEIVAALDGKMIYTRDGNRVTARDSSTLRLLFRSNDAPQTIIQQLAISEDGQLLATVGLNRPELPNFYSVWIRDARTGAPIRELPYPKEGRISPIRRVAFSPNGWYLAVAIGIREYNGDDIDLWDVRTGKKQAELRAQRPALLLQAMAFSVTGKDLVTWSSDAWFRNWGMGGLSPGGEFRSIERAPRLNQPVGLIDGVFTPDRTRLLTFERNTLFSWTVPGGKIAAEIPVPSVVPPEEHGCRLAVSPDGNYAAAADYYLNHFVDHSAAPNVIHVLNLNNDREVYAFHPGEACTRCLAFTADGKRLITALENSTVLVWNVSNPEKTTPR